MPSTLVHAALAAVVAAALLEEAFDLRSLALVVGLTAMADLDAFASLAIAGAHRSLLHTLLLPAVLASLVWYDARRGSDSLLAGTWNARGHRVAGVAIFAFVVSAIGLDLTYNGVNVLYPLHDQFYVLDGKAILSTTEGFVQTFVNLDPAAGGVPAPESLGNSSDVHLGTGVDPTQGPEPEDIERVFPIVRSGWQALIVGLGVLVPAYRLWDRQSSQQPGTGADDQCDR
ncbi:MAG: metal-dependent hydrolase [Haloarculaceae archaeon]